MKNFIILLCCLLFIGIFANNVSAQFTSTPDTTAMLDELYTYDADATGAISYTLEKGLPGMIFVEATGVISWTPISLTSGGNVIIKSNNGYTQSFFVYVSSGLECLPNAISYWNFDETSGTTYEDIYGVHDAVANFTAPFDIAGQVLRAKDVPASNLTGMDVVDQNDFHWGAGESFTISFWFKSDILDRGADPANIGVIVGRNEGPSGNHWWVGVNEINEVTFLVRDPNYPGGVTNAYLIGTRLYNNLSWHHIVCVRDAATNKLKIYFDGSLPADPGASVNYPGSREFFDSTTPAPLSIGYLKPVGLEGNYTMNGSIDELVIYNGVLSASDISSLYTKGSAHNPACEPGNYAPVFITEPDSITDEDQPYSHKIIARDIDNDTLYFTVVNKPSWLQTSISGDTITLSGTPVQANVGKSLVEISVSDGIVSVTQKFNLEVKNVNDPPVITSIPVTDIDEDADYSYSITYADQDDEIPILTYVTVPEWLSIDEPGERLYGTPTNAQVGFESEVKYMVKLKVFDGIIDSTQTFEITVHNVNDAPEITSTALLVAEVGSLYSYSFTATDVDNATVTLSAVEKPVWLSFSATTGLLSGTPELADKGTHGVVLRASDGTLDDEQSFTITVNGPVGLENLEAAGIQAYPLPAKEYLNLEFGTLPEETQLSVISSIGSLVKNVLISSGLTKYRLDLSGMETGVYYLHIQNSQLNNIGRFVVVK